MSKPQKRKRKPRIGTAAKLARLLRTEGWSDHLANECDRYIRTNMAVAASRLRAAERRQEEGAKILSALPEDQRVTVGRFISMHKGLAFEAGLRVGLGCAIHRMKIGEVEAEPPEESP